MFDIIRCRIFFLPVYYPKQLNIRIYRIIILLVDLYGCETWSLILREESRMRALRRNLGLRGNKGVENTT
jgi:hypothetical protein